jgi:hypothetical protein
MLGGVLLGACTRPALSRSEYRSRVGALCGEAKRALGALALPRAAPTGLVVSLRRLRAINRRLTNRIAVLDPPLGTDRSHDAAIAIGQRTDRALGRLTAALAGSASPARELGARRPALAAAAAADDHRWARLRLKACAGGPSAALASVATRTLPQAPARGGPTKRRIS